MQAFHASLLHPNGTANGWSTSMSWQTCANSLGTDWLLWHLHIVQWPKLWWWAATWAAVCLWYLLHLMQHWYHHQCCQQGNRSLLLACWRQKKVLHFTHKYFWLWKGSNRSYFRSLKSQVISFPPSQNLKQSSNTEFLRVLNGNYVTRVTWRIMWNGTFHKENPWRNSMSLLPWKSANSC